MSYVVNIELDDWEQLHSVVDILTGEITEFSQDFIDLTRAKLAAKYQSNLNLPPVPRKSVHRVFDDIVFNYDDFIREKRTKLKT